MAREVQALPMCQWLVCAGTPSNAGPSVIIRILGHVVEVGRPRVNIPQALQVIAETNTDVARKSRKDYSNLLGAA